MSKKKKLKRRLQQQAAATAPAGTLAEQLNTVNQGYSNQENNSQPVAAPIEPVASETSVSSAMDDWEDEDESTDGGTIPAVSITVNSEQQSTELQETANPNIEVPQQTAPQENVIMNVVNHPQQAPAPAPIAAPAPATVANEIVSEGQMEQMQQDAVFTPPAAVTTPVPAVANNVVENAPAKKQSAFHSLAMTVMVSLNLSNIEYMIGLKDHLSRVKLDGQEFNLYSPFRKAGKKAEVKPAAEGIVRYALSNMLDITDTLNNSRVMNVGDAESISANLTSAIDTMRNQIVNLFPTDMNTVIASLEDEENRQTIQLQLKDIVNVSSWVNTSAAEGSGVEAVTIHNAVINVRVNAGFLYDTEDRIKYINQVRKVLQMVSTSREDANTTLLLAVNLDSATLADKQIRELLDALLEGEDFTLYTRQEMHRLDESDFLPQTKESVDANLLAPNGDLLLLSLLTEEDDDEAELETEPSAEPVQ